jgi:site-specific DNA recombinase
MGGSGADRPKAVGVWIRVSTEDQVKGESPLHHEERARMYAELRGWQVAEVYRLDATSGKSVMGLPETNRMLADVRSGAIEGLVFSKLARLARNTKELLEFADIFRACNADMVSLAESIDTSSPAGRLFYTMIAAMAQWEREEIAERVRASVPIRARLGKPTAGAPPFGYCRVDGKLTVDEREAPVLRLMYELFDEHRRRKTVASILNGRGYRTRAGRKWSDTTLERLLRNPTAKGQNLANYTRRSDRTKGTVLKPESEWVWRECPAVVSDELWDRCNAALEARRVAGARRPAKKTVQLFTGYAFCACGTKLQVRHRSNKYSCPTCLNKIPVDDLEAVYRSRISAFIVSPDEMRAHREAADEALREKERLLESAGTELKTLQTEEDRLFDLYTAGEIPKLGFGRRLEPITQRRAQLDAELPRLQAERDVLKIRLLSHEAATHDARDLADRWESMTFEERRQVVEAITDRVVVGTDEIEITLVGEGDVGSLRHLPPEKASTLATHSQGFWAAISWKRAG